MPDGTLIAEQQRRRRPAAPAADPCAAGGGAAAALVPAELALARLLALAGGVAGTEALPCGGLAPLGRVLARPPVSARELPPFDQSAMDGYAFHAADLAAHAGPSARVEREIAAGAPAGPGLLPGQAVRVLTGARLPEGAAAVVMQEHAVRGEGGRVAARRAARPGDNIRRRGEDVAVGQALGEPGTRLDARHIALFAAAGVRQVTVRRRVRVAVLSNGDELGRGGVEDSNRPMLLASLARAELEVTDLGVLPDDRTAIAAALGLAAASHDLILSSGGVCGSEADHLPHAIRLAGGEAEVLKLALKPGKPLALGRIGRTVCLGLPGNPLAAFVGMLLFGRPLLAKLAGADPGRATPAATAVSGEAFERAPGREEFVPARVVGEDAASGLPVLERAGRAGSARLLPLSRADGLMRLPRGCARVAAGDAVRFHPFHGGS